MRVYKRGEAENRQIFASQPMLLSAVNKVHCGRQVGPILVNYLSEVPFAPRRLSCGHTVQPDPIQLPNGKLIYSRCAVNLLFTCD